MRRIEILTQKEKQQYRQRSQMAINGLNMLLKNTSLVFSKNGIIEKYRTIAQCLGLNEDGTSFYNYFVPLSNEIEIMLRLSNHNNTNGDLYNLHEKKGRPDARYIIYFQGTDYVASPVTEFCEANHYVFNYPITALDDEAGVKSLITSLIELLTYGSSQFFSRDVKPRETNDDVIARWNRTIDKNLDESKSNKHIIKTINENQLKQIVAEAVRRILNI